MGLLATLPHLIAALLTLGHATTGSDNFVVVTTPSVSVRQGHTATLPCWLNPPQSAESLEVQWYHSDNLDLAVMHYKNKKVSSPPSYDGRVSFGSKDATSGGLASGDVSLELANVTLKDSRKYTCYVSSDQSHSNALVTLAVTETGNGPQLSVQIDSNMVNVSCESEGWYPKPFLRWSDQKEALTPESVQYRGDSLGLLSVHSWVLVPKSYEITCTVGLLGGEEKESRLRLVNLSEPPQTESTFSDVGIVVLAILTVTLAISTIVLGLAFYKKRGKTVKLKREIKGTEEEKTKLQRELSDTEGALEDQRFLSKVAAITVMSKTKKNYVNIGILIPEGGHPNLSMRAVPKGYVIRDGRFPKGSKVSCLTAITGTPSFSSGEHYWEVSMKQPNTDVKKSWWLGVTSVSNIPQDPDFLPTASKGYWFLSSSSENPHFFQLSSEPADVLPVTSRPETVGVYLNCEKGEVAFFDADDSTIIGSLRLDIKGEVFPFFNPGLFDSATLGILHHSKPEPESSVTVNVENDQSLHENTDEHG